MATRPKRAWQRMLSGRRLDLLDPTPMDIEISDIAHGLAFVARWNGQTHGDWAYSVAEHSLLVEEIFVRGEHGQDPRWRLAARLHDAPEYVIGDMISPVKAALGGEYGEMDTRLTAAIHRRFGLPAQLPLAIKRAIKQVDPQAEVTIDRSRNEVQVDSSQPREALARAIAEEGYAVAA